MFNKILVPTDGSENSKQAFQTAVELARTLNSRKVILLHITFTPEALGYVLTGQTTVIQEQLNFSSQEIIDLTRQDIDTNGVTVVDKIRPGHPAVEILKEIEMENIDLIVMGNRGYGPITGSLLGSVSQKVLVKARCPVMIV